MAISDIENKPFSRISPAITNTSGQGNALTSDQLAETAAKAKGLRDEPAATALQSTGREPRLEAGRSFGTHLRTPTSAAIAKHTIREHRIEPGNY
jgi:hypothetical protein